MTALITLRRTNLVGQERWKLLIPLGDCPCQRAGMGLSCRRGRDLWPSPGKFYKRGKAKKKHFSRSWNFSTFAAHVIEQDLF